MEPPHGLLLSLPSELACFIVLHWLGPKSLCLLDDAYCNVALRKELCSTLYRSAHFCLDICPSDRHMATYLAWILKRNVLVKSLIVFDTLELGVVENCLSKFGQHVRSVTLQKISDHKADILRVYDSITRYCTSLVSLTCRSCLLNAEFVKLLFACKDVSNLRLRFCSEAPAFAITQINTKQRLRLKVLSLGSGNNIVLGVLHLCDLSYVERLVVGIETTSGMKKLKPLLAQCVNFQTLGFFGTNPTVLTDAEMIDIVSMCPQIVHLNIAGCDRLTDTSGICIAQTLTQLRTINISSCRFSAATINALAAHCNNTLEGLYCMCAVDGTSLNALIERCSKLHTLSFDCNRFPNLLNTPALCHITTLLLVNVLFSECVESAFGCFTHLQHLHLSFNSIEDIAYCPFHLLHTNNTLFIHTIPDRKSTNIPELCENMPSYLWFIEQHPCVKLRFIQHTSPPGDTLAYDVLELS